MGEALQRGPAPQVIAGIPSQPTVSRFVVDRPYRQQLPSDSRVIIEPILGGLHREYQLERIAA